MGFDELLNKVTSEIDGKEREIINEFCKAFMACKSLEGVTPSELFQKYTLCMTTEFSPTFGIRYWFEKKKEYER